MASVVSRTQPVDIYSKARVSGDPSRFTAILPEDACKALEGEVGMTVEMTSLQMLNCVTPIQNCNDSWLLVDTITGGMLKCTLPHCNVSIKGMANIVQGALPGGWIVKADETTNKLSFTPPASYPNPQKFVFDTLDLQVSAHSLLGFSKRAQPTFVSSVTTNSDIACDVGGPATVLVVADLPSASQAINLYGQSIGATVVQKVPLCCPFMSLMHHKDYSGTWAIHLPPINLNQITFGLLTEDLLPLDMELEWSCTLKVSYVKISPVLEGVRLLSSLESFAEMTWIQNKWTKDDIRQRKRIAEEARRVLDAL